MRDGCLEQSVKRTRTRWVRAVIWLGICADFIYAHAEHRLAESHLRVDGDLGRVLAPLVYVVEPGVPSSNFKWQIVDEC